MPIRRRFARALGAPKPVHQANVTKLHKRFDNLVKSAYDSLRSAEDCEQKLDDVMQTRGALAVLETEDKYVHGRRRGAAIVEAQDKYYTLEQRFIRACPFADREVGSSRQMDGTSRRRRRR